MSCMLWFALAGLGTYLNGSRVLLFVDHSGVHAACVSGSSKDPIWRSLLVEFERADANPMMGWKNSAMYAP